MPLIKIGKDYYNGTATDVYLMQGNATRDAETKEVGGHSLATVGIAAAKAADGSAMYVNLNGWRDRAQEVASIRKLDSVLAIGKLKSREHNGNTYYDLDTDFVALSGAGLAGAISKTVAGNAGTGTSTSFLDELQDIGDGELPF